MVQLIQVEKELCSGAGTICMAESKVQLADGID